MIERYSYGPIADIWSDLNKLLFWQGTELAVIKAEANLGQIPIEVYAEIYTILMRNPIDIDFWKQLEEDLKHDLVAFLEERRRFLPENLKLYLHGNGMTSYDTEEAAFAKMLKESIAVTTEEYAGLQEILKEMALKYRHTIMNGRTHGQEAELQTFGKRCLTWHKELQVNFENLQRTTEVLKYSKLSGAEGNYGGIDPETEKEALTILGFEPFYGATQIMPRELYAPIAHALSQLVLSISKIAIDIRLGARSGRPIYQESFGKKQVGSSTMPHKRNTISAEQLEGMARLAKSYSIALTENIITWEERSIEQSSVERVAWPDLFHVTIRSLKTISKVLKNLTVYPDNMLLEIVDSRGGYASSNAKEVLKKVGLTFGLSTEDAYRILQLAAFNVHEPGEMEEKLRNRPLGSFEKSNELLHIFQTFERPTPISIQHIIPKGKLKVSSRLGATESDIQKWNETLKKIFQDTENLNKWNEVFTPSHILRYESVLFEEILRQ